MVTANKAKGTATSMLTGIIFGVLLSLVYTCALAAIVTGLVLNGKIEESIIGYFVMGILITGAALGSLLAAVKIKRRWMMVCLLTGAGFYLTLLISTAVFLGGNYRGLGVSGLLVLIGSLISGIAGLSRNKSRDKGYRKFRNC